MGVDPTRNRNALRAVGVALGLTAAGLLVLATFLPRLHCPTIDLQHNRLIDRDEGLFLLACAGLVVLASIAGIRYRRAGWLLVLTGSIILGLTIYSATGSRSLVLAGVPGVQGAVHGELGL